ncbi:MAG: hypothetical protein EB127_31585 [Alphaproteobacteria bacterium]|nr:hypothetical protein [Alphaproteobacteria bacterium]
MAALKGFLYRYIKPEITLSQLETYFKKAAVDNTLTKETAAQFVMDTMSNNFWNKQIGEFTLYVLGVFKKVYDAEQAVKTGAAKLATYESVTTTDPITVLFRQFLTGGSRSIDGRITDSKLRFHTIKESILNKSKLVKFKNHFTICQNINSCQ